MPSENIEIDRKAKRDCAMVLVAHSYRAISEAVNKLTKNTIEQKTAIDNLVSKMNEDVRDIVLYDNMGLDHDRDLILELMKLIEKTNYAVAEALLVGASIQKKSSAKKAVSNRDDQKQKEGWVAHCNTTLQNGTKISTLDDLLSAPGYDPSVLNITPRTLKTWAREAGVVFKAGRPKE